MRKRIFFYFGNFLMVLSVSSLLFIYYPFISTYIFTPELKLPPDKGLYIQIPKIKAQAPILTNVNPYNQNEYRAALKKGVALAKGTGIPGGAKGSFLFAHSSDYPWNLSRYNTIFLRLGELNKGDTINIFKDGKKIEYVVVDKKTVWPTEVEYLQSIPDGVLILQTCTPIGTDIQRLLIFAKPKK